MDITNAEFTRKLRQAANMVQDRYYKALDLQTEQSMEQLEWAEQEFKKLYPHYEWRHWSTIEERSR